MQTPDWSAQICEGATIEDLDAEALKMFRHKLISKNPEHAQKSDRDILVGEDLMLDGKLTFTCFLFLGKYELRNKFLSSEINTIHYLYDDQNNEIEERSDIEIPWILNLPKLFVEIEKRNNTIEDIDLFRPTEKQYEIKSLEESVVNAIAHRDWQIPFWIDVRHTPSELAIHNPGYFVPDFEKVVSEGVDIPYKNPHLCRFLKTIDLMERERRGIKRKIYSLQIAKGLDISLRQINTTGNQIEKVIFTLNGKIKNLDFAKYMYNKHAEMDFEQIIILDKIASGKNQFGLDISTEEFEKVTDYISKSRGRGNTLKFKTFVLYGIVEKPLIGVSMKSLKSLVLDFAKTRYKERVKEFTIKEIQNKYQTNYNSLRVIVPKMVNVDKTIIKLSHGVYQLKR